MSSPPRRTCSRAHHGRGDCWQTKQVEPCGGCYANALADARAERDEARKQVAELESALSEVAEHAVHSADDPATCCACLSPGDDACPVMKARAEGR